MKVSEPKYVPAHINFVLPDEASEIAPATLFDGVATIDDARKEVAASLVALNEKVTVKREMDDFELSKVRRQYSEELEQVLPELEKKAVEAFMAAKEAKEKAAQAEEQVSACLLRIKELAHVAKIGVTDMELAASEVFKIPVKGKFLYYAFVNNALTLVKVADIQSYEKNDLINSSNNNDQVFENILNALKVANE